MIIQLVLFYYYYNTIYLYKCCIHNVLSYGHLYYHFGCNLHESEGLIKNSASFKSPHITHTSLAHLANDHEGLQIARTLYYLFNYLIIYFRLVVYIVTCTVYIYIYIYIYIYTNVCASSCHVPFLSSLRWPFVALARLDRLRATTRHSA